uniref:Uncharacterized protein n=1 Tax=Chromera velia CCMP2878 TaxID=1169474 RepID=A0A0G4HBF1_9ALVE|mmetsp:Transcript_1073/g.2234  ORF Transcript_1073/g.2234 Transcript_1073/m.2234 type:complete len:310 (+) Transcript_1073:182-1111(+)|eukprot:Cvel_25928.t1-p1 / transcript=Cvel_25928.t1 / gene=Cvel_25928 / organism=Chromera_velia_CCMP2878 / gene_product=hypothetical protein / transcript_product=hypothetical protein / location=Cvel_scaffold3000:13818-18561(+) / protein_length=309 / sequence_SO=supercontig / SO=protein_coding / is_pseudo=false
MFKKREVKKIPARSSQEGGEEGAKKLRILRMEEEEEEETEQQPGGESDGAGGENSSSSSLEKVRLLQKLRKKKAGLNASVDKGNAEGEWGEGADGMVDDDLDQYGLLEKQFVANGMSKEDKEDAFLEEFLKERLAELPGGASSAPSSSSASASWQTVQRRQEVEEHAEKQREARRRKEEALFDIPEHLRVEDETEKNAEKMAWVTGLVEVPISVEAKLKNIEATERAKRDLLQKEGKVMKKDKDTSGREREKEGGEEADSREVVQKAFGSRFQTLPQRRGALSSGIQGRSSDESALAAFRKRTFEKMNR